MTMEAHSLKAVYPELAQEEFAKNSHNCKDSVRDEILFLIKL